MTRDLMRAFVAGLAVSISTAVHAQTVYPPVQITNATVTGGTYVETSISVSKVNPAHIVAGCIETTAVGGNRLWYALTINGFATDARGHVPIPNCPSATATSYDPTTFASPVTDDLWVGGIVGSYLAPFGTGFTVWNCPPGSTSFGDEGRICPVPYQRYDKSLVAVGPSPTHAGSYRMYLGVTNRLEPCAAGPTNMLRWQMSDEGWPVGRSWPTPSYRITAGTPSDPCRRAGYGAAPAVVPANPLHPVRLVMTYTAESDGHDLPEVSYNQNLETQPEAGWVLAAISPTLDAGRISHFGSTASPIFMFSQTDIAGGSVVTTNYPSIAIDPTNPQRVYIVFAGKVGNTDGNVDMFVALSTDGGATFAPENVLRITDAQLYDPVYGPDPAGTDQFMPAVTVDKFGGVNLVYFRSSNSDNDGWVLDVCYARIANFSGSLTAPLAARRLRPPGWIPVGSPGDIGHYISIDTSNCDVWVSYPRTDNAGHCDVYVQRISLCPADVDSDAAVTNSDAVAFLNAYSTQQPPADINQDGQVNIWDAQEFVTAFTCGCGPQ